MFLSLFRIRIVSLLLSPVKSGPKGNKASKALDGVLKAKLITKNWASGIDVDKPSPSFSYIFIIYIYVLLKFYN